MPRSLAPNVQLASSIVTVMATFSSFFSAAYFTRPVASSGVMPLTSTPISFTPSRNVFFVFMMASISVGILFALSRFSSQMRPITQTRHTAAARSTFSRFLRRWFFFRLPPAVLRLFFAEAEEVPAFLEALVFLEELVFLAELVFWETLRALCAVPALRFCVSAALCVLLPFRGAEALRALEAAVVFLPLCVFFVVSPAAAFFCCAEAAEAAFASARFFI